MLFAGRIVEHYHIELPGVDEEIAQNSKLFFHLCLIVALEPGHYAVFLDFAAEFEFLEYAGDEPCPPGPSCVVSRSAFKVEADVVLVGSFSHQRLDGGEMEAEAGTQAAEIP